MKLFKFIFLFLIIIAVGISGWIYYPQFKINKLKQESVAVDTNKNTISLIDHYRKFEQVEIHHLALGDSVIRGYGAAETENLVSQFSSQLSSLVGKKVHFSNEGMNGLTSSELREFINNGQFDEKIKQADIITVNVGGNDLLRGAPNMVYSEALQKFDELQTTYSENLAGISSRIKQLNPDATILFLEQYNPVKPNDPLYSIANQLLPKWNIIIYEVAYSLPGSVVVETTKVINGENFQHLSQDGIHPSPAGYAAISKLMIEQLKLVQVSGAV